jgi:hypothetical protein
MMIDDMTKPSGREKSSRIAQITEGKSVACPAGAVGWESGKRVIREDQTCGE